MKRGTVFSRFIVSHLMLLSIPLHCLKLDRVILATDANPTYIEFWPVVARAWQNIVGLRPTLALIADDSVTVDETLGDVIRFAPIPGVATAQHAQIIRLFLPFYFPDDGCIISDIDMIPLNKDYFIQSIASVPDSCFVVYRDKAYGTALFPMCYNAALGKTFAEIFDIAQPSDIAKQIKNWFSLGYGWNTDEILLHRYLTTWQHYHQRCIKLGHAVEPRIDRFDWRYQPSDIANGYYIDAHCLRPYSLYKKEIDLVLSYLNPLNMINP